MTPSPSPSIPLVLHLHPQYHQRLQHLLTTDETLSLEEVLESALVLYLAYKRPDLFCSDSTIHHDLD